MTFWSHARHSIWHFDTRDRLKMENKIKLKLVVRTDYVNWGVFETGAGIRLNMFQSITELNLYRRNYWQIDGIVSSEHWGSIQRLHEATFAQGGSDAAQYDAWHPYLHCLVIDTSLQSILCCNIFQRLMTQEISRTIYLDAYHVILRNFP